jgi:hypothetical protein
MKKALLFTVVLLLGYSCIKKDALKYDPKLEGLWVSNSDSISTWLLIDKDGVGDFITYEDHDERVNGKVRYSLFEKKMWVGVKKFKVIEWLTGKTKGVQDVKMKAFRSNKDTTYIIDMEMKLKYTGVLNAREILFYKVHD